MSNYCKYRKECELYASDSFTCNKYGGFKCGKFREFNIKTKNKKKFHFGIIAGNKIASISKTLLVFFRFVVVFTFFSILRSFNPTFRRFYAIFPETINRGIK